MLEVIENGFYRDPEEMSQVIEEEAEWWDEYERQFCPLLHRCWTDRPSWSQRLYPVIPSCHRRR